MPFARERKGRQRMAIFSTSLLNLPALTAMADGVEFYVTECENVVAPTSDGEPHAPFRACAVLVSFAKSDTDRAALRPLLTALSFGLTTTGVSTGSEWLQKLPNVLSERLKAADHGSVFVVVYAGSGGESDAETVQSAADAIRQCFGTSLAALLVVGDSTSCRQFDRVQGVTGFVTGARTTSVETARSMFLCLAMLLAPKTLNGIDFVDLRAVLGTATEPTVLADALWLRDVGGQLVFTTDADASAVRSADRILAVPLINGPWGRSELRLFCAAVRAEAFNSDSTEFFAADEAIAPYLLSGRVATVSILCLSGRGQF